MRPDAGASIDGKRRSLADRERLARVRLEAEERRGAVGHRHLPRPHHLVARAEAADRPVADRDEERLVGDRRRAQHARRSPRRRSIPAAANGAEGGRSLATSRVMRGGLPSSAGRSMSTGLLPKSGSRTSRCCDLGRLADHRERAALALADGRKQRAAMRVRSPGRSAPAPRCTTPRAASCPAPRSAPRAGRCARRGPSRAPARAARSTGRPAPTSWIDRIGFVGAERAAAVDDLLRAPLDLGVARAAPSRSRGRRCWTRSSSTRPTRRPCRSASPGPPIWISSEPGRHVPLVRVLARRCCRRRPPA